MSGEAPPQLTASCGRRGSPKSIPEDGNLSTILALVSIELVCDEIIETVLGAIPRGRLGGLKRPTAEPSRSTFLSNQGAVLCLSRLKRPFGVLRKQVERIRLQAWQHDIGKRTCGDETSTSPPSQSALRPVTSRGRQP